MVKYFYIGYSSEKHIYLIDIKFEKEILKERIMNFKFKISASSLVI